MSSPVPAPGEPAADVAAVVLAWNQAEVTRECVEAIACLVGHVYVVDNNSQPQQAALLAELVSDRVSVLANTENLGYAGGCNVGIEAAMRLGAASILVMNNDAFPGRNGVRGLAERLEENPKAGAVGPAMVHYATGELLHLACDVDPKSGRTLWRDRGTPLDDLGVEPVPTGYISGEAMLVRREAIEDIGAFDPRYFCYYEDVDWSVRARCAGWELEVLPTVVWSHMVGSSATAMTSVLYISRNRVLFLRRALRRSRLAAALGSAPGTARTCISLAIRGHVGIAIRGALGGWLAGCMAQT